jgi:co-chaperonin GroES (HSP10)
MNISPAGHKILVKPRPVETKSKSGIILVKDENAYREATTEGTVVAIGPTAYKKVDDGTPWCKVGDYITFGKYAGALVVDEETDDKYVVIHDIDVVAVLTKD